MASFFVWSVCGSEIFTMFETGVLTETFCEGVGCFDARKRNSPLKKRPATNTITIADRTTRRILKKYVIKQMLRQECQFGIPHPILLLQQSSDQTLFSQLQFPKVAADRR